MSKEELVELIKEKIALERKDLGSFKQLSETIRITYIAGMKHVLDIVEHPEKYQD